MNKVNFNSFPLTFVTKSIEAFYRITQHLETDNFVWPIEESLFDVNLPKFNLSSQQACFQDDYTDPSSFKMWHK